MDSSSAAARRRISTISDHLLVASSEEADIRKEKSHQIFLSPTAGEFVNGDHSLIFSFYTAVSHLSDWIYCIDDLTFDSSPLFFCSQLFCQFRKSLFLRVVKSLDGWSKVNFGMGEKKIP